MKETFLVDASGGGLVAMRPSLDRAHDKLDRLLLVEASDSASLLASFRVLRCRIVNSGLVSRKCWLRTRRVSDEVNGRLRSSPFDLASALLPGRITFNSLHFYSNYSSSSIFIFIFEIGSSTVIDEYLIRAFPTHIRTHLHAVRHGCDYQLSI